MENTPKLRLIDLFCGAGGMTQGFVQSSPGSYQCVWANDNNEFAAETYCANFGDHLVPGGLAELLADKALQIPPADVVIGGPPCQGFSLLNKQRAGDDRRQLWRPFLEVVRRSGAELFVMENVPQLLNTSEHELILEEAHKLGFQTASEKLCAADYGVPQTRYRAFVIGCSFADPKTFFPPLKTHYNPSKGEPSLRIFGSEFVSDPRPWKTVSDAISDLPTPEGCEISDLDPPLNLHFGRNPTPKSRARYRAIPEEGMNRFDLQERAPELTPQCWIKKKTGGTDLFGRLWWDRPAFTIRTEFFKPEKGRYLHPKQHRPITHREAARFQSFPDNFIFTGSKIEIAKQIGNAVPPLLAAAIANVVHHAWKAHRRYGNVRAVNA